ncbi:MAG: C40 family peptidase, partial [Acidobacteria bacterium]|nr:C40 family peptidase [Acidobacteriota bacterium]
ARPDNVALLRPTFTNDGLAVFAAKVGKKVCRGRYKHVEINGRKSSDKKLLERYVAWLQKLENFGVAPRYWMGLRTFERFESDSDGASKISAMPASNQQAHAYTEWFTRRAVRPDIFPRESGGITVFGEDCSKRRHFDCIGFVNYCIAKAWGKPNWQYGYDTYRDNPGNCYGKSISLSKGGLKNGDLALRDPSGGGAFHIGIMCNGGASVVNAKGQDVGMGVDSYSSSKWDGICRINKV